MSALPTFLSTDVMKMPNIKRDIARYEQHLAGVVKAL
jgi:modulator of drug activity B